MPCGSGPDPWRRILRCPSAYRDVFGPCAAAGVFEPPPRFEHAGHRPGLSRAAARQVRRVALIDLADMPQPGVVKVVADRLEPALCRRGIAVDAVMRDRPRAKQPCPNRSLMIRAVAV